LAAIPAGAIGVNSTPSGTPLFGDFLSAA